MSPVLPAIFLVGLLCGIPIGLLIHRQRVVKLAGELGRARWETEAAKVALDEAAAELVRLRVSHSSPPPEAP